jgi:hypothetical protein
MRAVFWIVEKIFRVKERYGGDGGFGWGCYTVRSLVRSEV